MDPVARRRLRRVTVSLRSYFTRSGRIDGRRIVLTMAATADQVKGQQESPTKE